jgi:hypothetical protein
VKKYLLLLFFLGYQLAVYAQCAMCRAVPSSSMEGGGSVGKGLNTGILYLLAVPYVLIAIFGIYFFRRKSKG